MLFSPNVKGKKGGIAKFTITRENGDQVTFSLPWGTTLEEHLLGKIPPLTPTISRVEK
ncbi:hypothetical protein NEPTK9_000566 [Candidatus Neptunochlamydia vexilliferae]|uniref:Uncharacterized protein n=1 Tax=Candidatus Neptunichlamydia vexilliferae TaxID=1651774 RepID=A0ABS0B013_9BACT|nr:hypothetical protein [Candidatus Neptunochlamydia vexilliferae]